MGAKETSEPQVYPAPPQVVFDALLAGARQVGLPVTGADPAQGVVWADKSAGLMTWGENISIFVRPTGPQQTSVVVESRLKFGLVAWGAHKKNFELVHRAVQTGLSGGQHGHQQGPPPGYHQGPQLGMPQHDQQQGYQQPGQQAGHQQGQQAPQHGYQQPGHQGLPPGAPQQQQPGHQQGHQQPGQQGWPSQG